MEAPTTPLTQVIARAGLVATARALGITHQAVRKWEAVGRLPRTEWTGETRYAETMEALTGGEVTKAMLLAPWPAPGGPTGVPDGVRKRLEAPEAPPPDERKADHDDAAERHSEAVDERRLGGERRQSGVGDVA